MERALLRLPRALSRRPLATRTLTTSPRPYSAFNPGPSPPRLPKEEQELFEKLQAQSTGAFSTPRPDAQPSSSLPPSPSPSSPSSAHDLRARINQSPDAGRDAQADGGSATVRDGEELHPNVRRGAPPEFEGDVNPRTGEVGGPKNEPLRWGHAGDWSYNGRVTDF